MSEPEDQSRAPELPCTFCRARAVVPSPSGKHLICTKCGRITLKRICLEGANLVSARSANQS